MTQLDPRDDTEAVRKLATATCHECEWHYTADLVGYSLNVWDADRRRVREEAIAHARESRHRVRITTEHRETIVPVAPL